MTPFELIMACVGFILCATLFALCAIVIIGIVCWVFKTEMDITIDEEDYE